MDGLWEFATHVLAAEDADGDIGGARVPGCGDEPFAVDGVGDRQADVDVVHGGACQVELELSNSTGFWLEFDSVARIGVEASDVALTDHHDIRLPGFEGGATGSDFGNSSYFNLARVGQALDIVDAGSPRVGVITLEQDVVVGDPFDHLVGAGAHHHDGAVVVAVCLHCRGRIEPQPEAELRQELDVGLVEGDLHRELIENRGVRVSGSPQRCVAGAGLGLGDAVEVELHGLCVERRAIVEGDVVPQGEGVDRSVVVHGPIGSEAGVDREVVRVDIHQEIAEHAGIEGRLGMAGGDHIEVAGARVVEHHPKEIVLLLGERGAGHHEQGEYPDGAEE